ncbi:MAG TPA: UvrD-helicase domain-containing protein, partial [Solirubrobacterales bacterium]|nr:UvrD-helicase domain-containing protein [Solirubrobacterales bacterium]
MRLTAAQERVVGHGEGPLLVLGEAGTGKSEALARRLARLGPERVLVLASTRATGRRLRERVESLLDRPYEELWIGAWETLGERLLREHSEAAGLGPFFDVVGPAERLAMLLDRLDELPLRRHEIRGNPAGLLARLLERIDALKAAAVGPEAIAARARERGESAGGDAAVLEEARREHEFAELFTMHDRILAAAGSLDRGDLFLALNCLLADRPDVRRQIATRFPFVMVDELEDTTPAQLSILAALAKEHPNHLYALEEVDSTASPAGGAVGGTAPEEASATAGGGGSPAATGPAGLRAWSLAVHPNAEVVRLESQFRDPPVRFWACASERAQAQAVARETEHLLATGAEPEAICVLIDEPAARGGPVAAAMEERGIPFHLSGPVALFQAPEVRDAVAWLRVLADPTHEGGAVAAAMEERGIPFHLAGPTALFQRAEVRDAIAWLRV